MKGKYFKSEFNKRLFRLSYEINRYYDTGLTGNIMPYLWQIYSYLWSNNPYKNKR